MKVFSVESIWKKSATSFMLKDVTFSMNDGEWLLISGPVGEGKETLQKIILGFDTEWNGSIFLNGDEIKGINNYVEKIAFIHNHLGVEGTSESVYDFLSFSLRLTGKQETEISHEINRLLCQFSLVVNLKESIKNLSIQEKLVIAFVRATLQKPSLIVIDEPFYQLSNSQRKVIFQTFQDNLRSWKGCPIIIFSSYVFDWLSLCDKLAVIYNKRLLQTGKPEDLIANPHYRFVSNYLDNEGFTFLKGVLQENKFFTKGLSWLLPKRVLQDKPFIEGQQLFIGIKATSFQLVDKPIYNDLGVTIEVLVHMVKEEKTDCILYGNIGGQPLVAQIIKSDKINEGTILQLFLPFEQLLFFDGNTEKRLIQRG